MPRGCQKTKPASAGFFTCYFIDSCLRKQRHGLRLFFLKMSENSLLATLRGVKTCVQRQGPGYEKFICSGVGMSTWKNGVFLRGRDGYEVRVSFDELFPELVCPFVLVQI